MSSTTSITSQQSKPSSTPRQSAAQKARRLERTEYKAGDIIADAQGVSRRHRADIAHTVGIAYASLAGDVRNGLLAMSRGWRMGCASVIDGRHGYPCQEIGTTAAMWFDTLTDIEGPIMALDRKETPDKAWRILHGMLPAFCDLKGRAWVEEQLEAKRAHFERMVMNCLFNGVLMPPLLTRPRDIADTHQIRLEELRAYGANRCGLTSINPETLEEKTASKCAARAKWRLDQGMTPQKDRTLTKDKAAYAKRHKTTVYQIDKQLKAGTLTREDLREPDDLRKNVWSPSTYNDATLFREPADALEIQPATVATAIVVDDAGQGQSWRFMSRSILVRAAHLDLTVEHCRISPAQPMAGQTSEVASSPAYKPFAYPTAEEHAATMAALHAGADAAWEEFGRVIGF